MKLTPEYATSTRAWPGPGVGAGASSRRSSSGPPGRWTRMASMGSVYLTSRMSASSNRGEAGANDVTLPVEREPDQSEHDDGAGQHEAGEQVSPHAHGSTIRKVLPTPTWLSASSRQPISMHRD